MPTSVVILTTFRPVSVPFILEEAANQGKQIFAENAAATDPAGTSGARCGGRSPNRKLNRGRSAATPPTRTLPRAGNEWVKSVISHRRRPAGTMTGLLIARGANRNGNTRCNWYYLSHCAGDHIVEQHICTTLMSSTGSSGGYPAGPRDSRAPGA